MQLALWTFKQMFVMNFGIFTPVFVKVAWECKDDHFRMYKLMGKIMKMR